MGSATSLRAAVPDEGTRNRTLVRLPNGKLLVLVGLMAYAVSFLLLAVGQLRGYFCAELALLYPWGSDGRILLREKPLEFFSLLTSGWVNPLFLAATAVGFWRPRSTASVILTVLTVLSIPACWVVFYYEGFHAREGHVLWIAGMVLTLAAAWLTGKPSKSESH
jgi:hypothetical protein